MKHNIGLQRIDGHRSHIKNKRSSKFLQRICFSEYEDERLKVWFMKYRNDRDRKP